MDLRETVLALFCDPEGNPCFRGSDGDHEALRAALPPVTQSPEVVERSLVVEYMEALQEFANDGDIPNKIRFDSAETALKAALSALPQKQVGNDCHTVEEFLFQAIKLRYQENNIDAAKSAYWLSEQLKPYLTTQAQPKLPSEDEAVEVMAEAAFESRHGKWNTTDDNQRRIYLTEARAAYRALLSHKGGSHE